MFEENLKQKQKQKTFDSLMGIKNIQLF